MIDLRGQYNTARVFSDSVEEEAISQIIKLCNQEAFKGKKVRIMPDVHAGKGCVIGFTAELGDQVIPNLIGVDIGCGMLTTNLGKGYIDFEKLDDFIRHNIPHGFRKYKSVQAKNLPKSFVKQLSATCKQLGLEYHEQLLSIGTLGGGNHFIEVNEDSQGYKWLVIHSGSRHFGLEVATLHQQEATKRCRQAGVGVPADLSFLEGISKEIYFDHMRVAQEYAVLNRRYMTEKILHFLEGQNPFVQFETVHNYINFNDKVIRKGAISAHKGEQLLIPLNMRDGSIIAVGKGNYDWNSSAPHGAGRKYSRHKAKKIISLDEFRDVMQGVWTTSISRHTLDEAPQAYKPADEIIRQVESTVEIIDVIKPLYNFKA